MPGRSSAPIVLRFSVSIRPWAQAKLIQQNVLTVTSIESKSSNAASLVKLPAANHRQTPLSRSVGDVSGEPVIPQDHCGRSAGERSPDQLPWRLGRPTGGRWSLNSGNEDESSELRAGSDEHDARATGDLGHRRQ